MAGLPRTLALDGALAVLVSREGGHSGLGTQCPQGCPAGPAVVWPTPWGGCRAAPSQWRSGPGEVPSVRASHHRHSRPSGCLPRQQEGHMPVIGSAMLQRPGGSSGSRPGPRPPGGVETWSLAGEAHATLLSPPGRSGPHHSHGASRCRSGRWAVASGKEGHAVLSQSLRSRRRLKTAGAGSATRSHNQASERHPGLRRVAVPGLRRHLGFRLGAPSKSLGTGRDSGSRSGTAEAQSGNGRVLSQCGAGPGAAAPAGHTACQGACDLGTQVLGAQGHVHPGPWGHPLPRRTSWVKPRLHPGGGGDHRNHTIITEK